MAARLPNCDGIAVTVGITVCGGAGSDLLAALPGGAMFCAWMVGGMVVVGGTAGSALTASVKLTRPPGRSGLMLIASNAAWRASRAPTVIELERSEGSDSSGTNDWYEAPAHDSRPLAKLRMSRRGSSLGGIAFDVDAAGEPLVIRAMTGLTTTSSNFGLLHVHAVPPASVVRPSNSVAGSLWSSM